MTSSRWLLSLLLTVHVGAITIGAIPAPNDFGNDATPVREPGTTIQARLTAVLDRAHVVAVRLHRITFAATTGVRAAATWYLDVTDQFAKWNMFSNPSRFQEYVRMDYWISPSAGPPRVESEVVFPAAAAGEWRLVEGYFASFTDKAFSNGLEVYNTRARVAAQRDQPPPRQAMHQDLVPFLRSYARRRLEGHPPDVRLLRAELWKGSAPMPEPGAALDSEVVAARLRAIAAIGQRRTLRAAAEPPDTLGAVRQDEEFTWRLLAIEEP